MADSITEFKLPLSGKLALITGASRGIGEGIAFELARRGASVILAYSSPDSTPKIESLIQKIQSLPHKPTAYPVRADLTSPTGPQDIISSLVAWSESQNQKKLQLDILINNAGLQLVKPVGNITADNYHKIYNLNVLAPLLLTQAALPHLNPAGHNRIINIGSVAARGGFKDLSLYCSSKAALEGLTRCWAAELGGDGTTVNCVNPGPVQSEMLDGIPREIVEMQRKNTPVEQRIGTVGEVSKIVAGLAGEDGGWVSGQVISASGGWAMY
ncbi:3-ketoacyl-acyl carrier protein reductase [Pseudomassariella vexata]|uniref:3-ketoacyl-acyl carrier protein reductase n=1 Tax=Pseudomassariella vexata TaxID=1141098 RepID=A0A1Y2DFU3_9PEZI|nr:3-ketoacyl-acyl carrier protein reductase [Pseudomassariella vexata]ORY58089.1 3-ketoacyl-acyl carrier protein reductase [Pseudomassariella vexata]